MAYDDGNVFARILRGEIPARTVLDETHVLAFHDIQAQAPVHVLVIPKGRYVSLDEFSARASPEEQAALMRAIGRVASQLGLAAGGFRVIANSGADANQEVPHLHFHILGGRPLGPMLSDPGG